MRSDEAQNMLLEAERLRDLAVQSDTSQSLWLLALAYRLEAAAEDLEQLVDQHT